MTVAQVKLALVKPGVGAQEFCTGQLLRSNNRKCKHLHASACPQYAFFTEQTGVLAFWLAQEVRVCVGASQGCRKELPGTDFYAVPKKNGDRVLVSPPFLEPAA